MLKLQEEYLAKLKQSQDDQVALAKAQDELTHKEAEAQSIQEQSRQAIEGLRTRYARLEAAENARLADERADAVMRARRDRWKEYGCLVAFELKNVGSKCTNESASATFAPDTPDAKQVVPSGTPISLADGVASVQVSDAAEWNVAIARAAIAA